MSDQIFPTWVAGLAVVGLLWIYAGGQLAVSLARRPSRAQVGHTWRVAGVTLVIAPGFAILLLGRPLDMMPYFIGVALIPFGIFLWMRLTRRSDQSDLREE